MICNIHYYFTYIIVRVLTEIGKQRENHLNIRPCEKHSFHENLKGIDQYGSLTLKWRIRVILRANV